MTSHYLFAIVDSIDRELLTSLRSFEDHPLTTLGAAPGPFAITGPMPAAKLRPRRANLKIHHDVIDHLVAHAGAVLPFSFGNAADSQEITDLLARRRQELLDHLQQVRGCLEVTLRLRTEEGQIFSYVVNARQDLQALSRQIFAPGAEPSREEKIHLGQRFEASRRDLRAHFQETLCQALDDLQEDLRVADDVADDELARLTFLVHRDRRPDFEARIQDLAATLDDELILQVSPFLAPYTFANMTL